MDLTGHQLLLGSLYLIRIGSDDYEENLDYAHSSSKDLFAASFILYTLCYQVFGDVQECGDREDNRCRCPCSSSLVFDYCNYTFPWP